MTSYLRYVIGTVLLMMLSAVQVLAQPVASTGSSGGNGAASSVSTGSFTISGTNRYLRCTVATQDTSKTASSVVMSNGSTALTFRRARDFDNAGLQARSEYWDVVAPPTGSTTVTATMSASTAVSIACRSYTNVDQTTPRGTFVDNGGSSNTASVTVTSATGDLVVDATSVRVGTTLITEGSGQTLEHKQQSTTGAGCPSACPGAGNVTLGMSNKAGATSVAMSWTVDDSTTKSWAIIGVSLKAPSGGGTPPTITTTSPLTSGTMGTAYSTTFAATGGTTPYTWSLASGTLPAGLSLSSGGVLSGTPTNFGGFTFNIRATGANSAFDEDTFNLVIGCTPTTRKVYAGGTSGGGDTTYTNSQAQQAFYDACPGDTIYLQNNITYNNLITPAIVCAAGNSTCHITVKSGINSSGTLSGSYPAANIRLVPPTRSRPDIGTTNVAAADMAKIQSNVNNSPALRTIYPSGETGLGNGCTAPCVSTYWKFENIEFPNFSPWNAGAIIIMGTNKDPADPPTGTQDKANEIPHHFIFDHVWIHGDPIDGQHRCFSAAANELTVQNSWIDYCFSVQETQAVSIVNQNGPQYWINNFFSGSGETFFTGGADPYGQFKATVLASPAPTVSSARLSNCEEFGVSADHMWFTIEIGGVEHERQINTINTGTCDITWFDPLPSLPDQPGDADNVQWNWVLTGLDVEKNYITKSIAWRNPYLAAPTGTSAKVTATGGTLAAGTNFYVIQARQNTTNSIYAQSDTTAEFSAVTTGTTSKVDLSWNAVTNADEYYVYWRLGNATRLLATVAAPTTTYTHTSPTAGTAVNGTVQNATVTPNTSSGTLPAGTYYYRVEARPASTLPPSPVLTCTLTATGKCDLSWSAVTGATSYRVWKGGNGTVVQSQTKWLCTSSTCASGYTTTGTTFSDSVSPGVQGTDYINEDIFPGNTPTVPTVKNTLELKNCKHCTIKGNIIENSWLQAQTGMVVNIKTNNQGGEDNSGTIDDVDVSYNIVRNGTRAFQYCAFDCGSNGSGVSADVRTRHNLVYNIDSSWGTSQSAISLTEGWFGSGTPSNRGGQRYVFDHNTFLLSRTDSYPMLIDATTATIFPTVQWTDLKWTNNITRRGQFGWHAIFNGSFGGGGEGTVAWNNAVNGVNRQFAKNVHSEATCVNYPDTPNNYCPTTEAAFQACFNNYAAGDYSLAPSCAWNNQATDGTDIGVDWVTLKQLTDIALSGDNSGTASSDFRLEAEDFDAGGEGTAYHDTDTINNGGAYRPTEGVDIEPITGGGYDVGWAFATEWLHYTHTVATTGSYSITFRVASSGSGGTFHLEVDNVDVTGTMTVPDTGGWSTWTLLTKTGVSLTAGSHVFRLEMDSNSATTTAVGNFDWIDVVLGVSNTAPVVNAGTDQTLSTPSPVANLDGTVSDDGLPNPPATVTTTWTVQSQPGGGSVTFGNASAVDTTATFNNTTGTYTLRLTASDSALSTFDEMTVTVGTPSNTPPTVNAGADKSTTLPAGIALVGSASDDGLPNPPGALTLTWSKTSGPGTVTFADPSAPITVATFSIDGTYVLRLTANDGAAATFDEMTATVAPAPVSTLTLRADRFTFNTGSCTMRSGAGPPSALVGCDTYIDSSTGRVHEQSASLSALASVNDLTLDVAGKDILPLLGYDTNLGSLQKKFLTLHAAELWVETLVAQNTIATIGGRVIVAPTTYLTADLNTSATVIQVKHNNLVNGDRIYMEANGQVEFMNVTSTYSGSAGAYLYSVTRNVDGSGANNWSAGDAIVSTLNGFIDLYSTRGVRAGTEVGPTIAMNVRNSLTYNDWSPGLAFGNLQGLYGYTTPTFGVAMGNPSAAWIKIDPVNGVRLGHNLTTVTQIDTAGNASFTGRITSTSGVIGGFTLLANYLYSGAGATKVVMSSDGTSAFWAGNDNQFIAPFYVGANGFLRASNAQITGSISASTISGGSITGTTITATSISGGSITSPTISAAAISGSSITSGTISGNTITGSSITAGNVTIDSSGISISAGTAASSAIKWSNTAQVFGNSSYIEVYGPSEVRLTTSGTVTADGIRPSSSGQQLGDSTHRWGETYIQGDIHQTPSDTTSADLPMVYSVGNGIYYKKTNGYNGTCSNPTSITIQNGIVTGCS